MSDLDKVFEQPLLLNEAPPEEFDEGPPPDLSDYGEDGNVVFEEFMDALEHTGGVWDCTHVDLLNIPITIHGFVEVTTKYGKALVAKVEDEGAILYALLGGQVLIKQLLKVKDYLPLSTTIVKKEGKRYYEFGRQE